MMKKNLVFRIDEAELKKFKVQCKIPGLTPSLAMRLFIDMCINDGEYLLTLIGKRAKRRAKTK